MIRSAFLASLPGFALLTKLWPGLKKAPAEAPKVWGSSGPLHSLLLRRRDELRSRGGDPKFFQCNAVTKDRLIEEIMDGAMTYGRRGYRFHGYQAIQVEGLTWVDRPHMIDDHIWVHRYACTRCCDTGQIGNMQMAGNRVYGLIPDPVPFALAPCPRCQ